MNNKKHPGAAKVLCTILLFSIASHAFAIIRSPYPAKSFPPYRGIAITIGGDSLPATAHNGH
jgi:hypothetical protein